MQNSVFFEKELKVKTKGRSISKIVNSHVSIFSLFSFTNLSLRTELNKTDAKLLTSELTILQIYRPLKVSCLLPGYSIHWWMLPLSPSDGAGAWRKAAQGSHHVRQWSQTSNLDQVRAKIQHTPHRRVLWAILVFFFSFFFFFFLPVTRRGVGM